MMYRLILEYDRMTTEKELKEFYKNCYPKINLTICDDHIILKSKNHENIQTYLDDYGMNDYIEGKKYE